MVLPDTYERQMIWWKSHQEAAGMKAEKRERELTKGLTFKPRLVTNPPATRVRAMPQSPRGQKSSSLHISRQAVARQRKPKVDPRGPLWSPPESGRSSPQHGGGHHGSSSVVPHTRLDLTALGPPWSSSAGNSPDRRTSSREGRPSPAGRGRSTTEGGGYTASTSTSMARAVGALAQQPPPPPPLSPGSAPPLTPTGRLFGHFSKSPRNLEAGGGGGDSSKKRPKPVWNPVNSIHGGRGKAQQLLASSSAAPGGMAGKGVAVPETSLSPRQNRSFHSGGGVYDESLRSSTNRSTSRSSRQQQQQQQAVMALGGDELDDDEEEELKFYEQLQREKREWQKERTQLLTVIELQQRELGKRANSVQERAAEIAREFAKSVMTFEERLVALETGTQSDMKDIRVMVSKILAATSCNETDTETSSLAQTPHPPTTTTNASNTYSSASAPATTSQQTQQPVSSSSTTAGGQYYAYSKKGGHA